MTSPNSLEYPSSLVRNVFRKKYMLNSSSNINEIYEKKASASMLAEEKKTINIINIIGNRSKFSRKIEKKFKL